MPANINGRGADGLTPQAPPDQPQIAPGANGDPAHCSTWGDDPAHAGQSGSVGYVGSNGLDGSAGQDGVSIQFVINDLLGGINVDCSGGTGGSGGPGGRGGQGGNGGDGGSGMGCEANQSAGAGGTGGRGGDGGRPNDGGNGGDVTILYSTMVGGNSPMVASAGGMPGIGGQPGPGGAGGIGGLNGDGSTRALNGSPGPNGNAGPYLIPVPPGQASRAPKAGKNGNIVIAPRP